jgi:hypothetical protein
MGATTLADFKKDFIYGGLWSKTSAKSDKETTVLVEDDTSLFSGIKNLALSYFDTTSIANKHGVHLKDHFDFQTVKGEDWASSVADILGNINIGDFGEKGRDYLKKAIKGPKEKRPWGPRLLGT